MGLGTKIKEALSGDKPNHGSQRRKTPGAYPESTVDIPRTTHTDTWRSTPGHLKQDSPTTKEEGIADHSDSNEYTHAPNKSSTNPPNNDRAYDQDDDNLMPSPDSRIAGADYGTSSKDYKTQSPYWGNISNTEARRATSPVNNYNTNQTMLDAAQNTDRGGLARIGNVNGVSNGLDQSSSNGRAQNDRQFDGPLGNVTRGQPQLIDDDAARATSMAASQVSQPSGFNDSHEPDGLTYGKAGYSANHNEPANHYSDAYGVQRAPTVTSKAPMTNARGTFGSPLYHDEHTFNPQQPQPAQTWPQQHHMRNTSNIPNMTEPHAQAYAANGVNNTSPVAARDQMSPIGGSDHGSEGVKAMENDHYGPGHSGAKVLHRCQHCGCDNDITRYFSKDVVYRLS